MVRTLGDNSCCCSPQSLFQPGPSVPVLWGIDSHLWGPHLHEGSSPQERTYVEGASPSPSEQPGSVQAAPWFRILVGGRAFRQGATSSVQQVLILSWGRGGWTLKCGWGGVASEDPLIPRNPTTFQDRLFPAPGAVLPSIEPTPNTVDPVSWKGPRPQRSSMDSPRGEKGAQPLGLPRLMSRLGAGVMCHTPFSPPKAPSKSPPPFPPSPRVRASSKPPVQDIRGNVSLGSSPSFKGGLPGKPQGQDQPESQTHEPWVRLLAAEQTTWPGSPKLLSQGEAQPGGAVEAASAADPRGLPPPPALLPPSP